MTAQLRNDFFVCVDNFAKEKERDHKQRTPGEGLTHKYNPHILADLAKICLIFKAFLAHILSLTVRCS